MPNEHPFTNLLDRITQRPLKLEQLTCLYCEEKSLSLEQVSTTLLGFAGSVNPNHICWVARCPKPYHTFNVESKGSNYWIVGEDDVVLAGLPNCFENYFLTCAACKGDVSRFYTALDGITYINSLSHKRDEAGKWGKQYRTFWACVGECKWCLETDDDYWRPQQERA